MAEYIDKAAAIAIATYAVDEHPYKVQGEPETYSGYYEGWYDACDYIRDRLDELGAADVVPVVRCKDCRHCETDYVHEGEYTCFYTGAMGLTLDDFCSNAEGKDEHDKSNNDNR